MEVGGWERDGGGGYDEGGNKRELSVNLGGREIINIKTYAEVWYVK